jgi:hypothetical protein
MVKDFYSEYERSNDDLRDNNLRTDYSFMTNADAVFFALKDIIVDPVNPFTNKSLQNFKTGGANITTLEASNSYYHSKYMYNIGKDQWLYVHDNIFEEKNWSKAESCLFCTASLFIL